jgi:inorganic pyrophosphatase
VEFDVVIEIPKGQRNKYEMDHKTGRIRLDRMLFTSTRYPADYGFVEHTLADDGDPLDALVVLTEPTFPGCRIRARAIGVFWMEDEKGDDAKIVCVPMGDPTFGPLTSVERLDPALRREIEHFFAIYKDLEPGGRSVTRGWGGVDDARRAIAEARRRYGEVKPSR